MGREYELKFRATAEQLDNMQAHYGSFDTITMETTYYDTPDKDLRQRKWMLRRRLENGTSVCTLKTPLPDGSRGEWETECEDIHDAIAELCNLGAPEELLLLTQSGLEAYCGARFIRLARLLENEAVTLELALDRGVFLGGGREEPFWEAEVEFKSGSENAAVAFAHSLALTFGLVSESRSKVVRAMALAQD